jgi:hypothetical protein
MMNPTDVTIAAAAAVSIIGAIASVIGLAYKFARNLEAAIGKDDEGHSLADRMKAMEARVARVEHQVFPNGGGSLLDKVNKVNTQVTAVAAETKIIASLLTTLVENNEGRAR